MIIFTMILIGLHYLDNLKERIHHRDLKPANILIFKAENEETNIVKIADFGISKLDYRTIIAD